MNTHPSDERLNDFVDGVLEPDRAADVERHIAGCDRCRAEVERTRAVLRDLAALPRSIQPPSDLLPRIAERIAAAEPDGGHTDASAPASPERHGAPALSRPGAGRHPFRSRSVWSLRYPLAAAAIALVALSSLLTAVLIRGGSEAADPGRAAATGAAGALFTEFTAVEDGYARAVAELLQEFERQRSSLPPDAVAIIEQNLRVIDDAIRESRAALDAHPADGELKRAIMATYEKKLDLLRRATRITARS